MLISQETTDEINRGTKTIKLYENIELHSILNEVVQKNVDVVADDEIGSLTQAFNSMVVQLKKSMEELRKSEEKYRSIFDNATEGILQSTLQGELVRSFTPGNETAKGSDLIAENF